MQAWWAEEILKQNINNLLTGYEYAKHVKSLKIIQKEWA